MQYDFFKGLAKITGLSDTGLINIIKSRGGIYSKFLIPKKTKGYRTIFHPCKEIKLLQYASNTAFLELFKESSIARAYIKGIQSPLRKIALEHSKYKYTIRVDFENFFPSITPQDFTPLLREQCYINDDKLELIGKIFFLKTKGEYILPIGAPTSPKISNIVMYKLDEAFRTLADVIDKKSCVSRYADDLYFSTNIKGICKLFLDAVRSLLLSTSSPKLKINEDKTLFLSKANKRIVCGIFITSDGKISLGRKRKEFIKKRLYLYNKGKLSKEEVYETIGHLSFCMDCDHTFYNKVLAKYGADILKKGSF